MTQFSVSDLTRGEDGDLLLLQRLDESDPLVCMTSFWWRSLCFRLTKGWRCWWSGRTVAARRVSSTRWWTSRPDWQTTWPTRPLVSMPTRWALTMTLRRENQVSAGYRVFRARPTVYLCQGGAQYDTTEYEFKRKKSKRGASKKVIHSPRPIKLIGCISSKHFFTSASNTNRWKIQPVINVLAQNMRTCIYVYLGMPEYDCAQLWFFCDKFVPWYLFFDSYSIVRGIFASSFQPVTIRRELCL